MSTALEATGEFPFTFYIEKAEATLAEKDLVLEGVASTANVDHDHERFSPQALKAMEEAINKESVPLRVEHSKSDSAVIGRVDKAWVDDRNQLHVRATLDKSHPVSGILYNSMKQGAKMGFSVGGVVKHAVKEFVEHAGKVIKTFHDVALKEVSVTPRPANYDAWAVAKSLAKSDSDTEELRNSPWYKDFLTENPQLDYMHSFAKSIPDNAWRPVDVPIIKTEDTMENKEKGSEKESEETKSYVTKKEFESFANAMSKTMESGFGAVAGLLKTLGSDAKDQHQPEEKKPVNIGDTAHKMDSGAQDQNNPDEAKPKGPGDTASKAAADDETTKKEDEDTTKKEDEDTTKKEEDESSEKKADTSEYEMETVNRSIAAIEAISKRMMGKAADEEDTTKKEDEDTTKKEDEDTTKGVHPLDQFVKAVTIAMTAMSSKMEKSGKSYLGFEKSIIDTIRNDKSLQTEIQKMMQAPGRKQSVSMGVPFMVTKEGRRYSLSANEVAEPVAKSKSEDKGKSFSDVYKQKYSTVATATEE